MTTYVQMVFHVQSVRYHTNLRNQNRHAQYLRKWRAV